ncbi:MAG: DMT family transporter [Hyphomicrobiales bacterium]
MTETVSRSPAVAPAYHDNPALALLYGSAGIFAASSMDAVMKGMSGSYPVHELMVIRGLSALPFMTMLAWREAGTQLFRPRRYPLIVMRGLLMCSAYIAFMMAIAAMPLADGVALYFTMPLFVAAFAGVVLGEHVPGYRWAAIAGGFVGTLIMVKPGSTVFDPAALFALYSAAGYALGQIFARRLGVVVTPGLLAFHQNLIYLTVAVVLATTTMMFGLHDSVTPSLAFLTRAWTMPPLHDLLIVAALGPVLSVAMFCFSSAYRLGPATMVAPLEYTSMFWAVVFGYLFWNDVPGWETIVGAAIVAGAGLYMLSRDRAARARTSA